MIGIGMKIVVGFIIKNNVTNLDTHKEQYINNNNFIILVPVFKFIKN